MIAELHYSNITTVEQLANLSDANAQQYMGNFRKLRERAKNFLQAAAGEAPAIKLRGRAGGPSTTTFRSSSASWRN